MPALHPPEFRRRAVDLGRAGEQTVAVIATGSSPWDSFARGVVALLNAGSENGEVALPASPQHLAHDGCEQAERPARVELGAEPQV